jgi:hypothetical protein
MEWRVKESRAEDGKIVCLETFRSSINYMASILLVIELGGVKNANALEIDPHSLRSSRKTYSGNVRETVQHSGKHFASCGLLILRWVVSKWLGSRLVQCG